MFNSLTFCKLFRFEVSMFVQHFYILMRFVFLFFACNILSGTVRVLICAIWTTVLSSQKGTDRNHSFEASVWNVDRWISTCSKFTQSFLHHINKYLIKLISSGLFELVVSKCKTSNGRIVRRNRFTRCFSIGHSFFVIAKCLFWLKLCIQWGCIYVYRYIHKLNMVNINRKMWKENGR